MTKSSAIWKSAGTHGLAMALVLAMGLAAVASAQPGGGWYRMKTQFQGEGKCFEGNKFDPGSVLKGAAFMDNCQNVSGQLWKFEREGNSGWYRLKTQFQGEGKCLEGNKFDPGSVLGGAAFMDNCQNVSGQLWKFELVASGSPGCAAINGTQCYWMENTTGNFCWVQAPWGQVDINGCFDLDSCSGGRGQSGGGCYKWADCSDCQRYPWP